MVDEAPSSPGTFDGERQRGQTRTERVAVGGEATCGHPDSALAALGVGAPLHFERCGRCGAVLLGRLVDRTE